ncbi:DUF550 domain-containing protein [Salmonella enterica]|nr:DUF550 domain-containing protein [Salmonella enterica]EID7413764.1 DUF550 domain-containing protein [Salmonella enterica]EIL4708080.1 DUF550 domain-containing protein [Salmonella enterica]EIW4272033.1 DUF550 domain-containing protein [Salmonella enterica]EIX3165384.1 DUF550 domain-containing protein [Salmonella enterica]
MTTITRFTKEQLTERARRKVKELEFAIAQSAFTSIRDGLKEELELARIALASLTAEPVLYAAEETLAYANMGEIHLTCLSEPMGDAVIPLYTDSPVSEREQVRRKHAEWSDKTFGDVGPVGPLKHLSKEALEAAADPSDPLEWADMQFLLWDAQRRAGITDKQITLAMVKKLAINKTRQWPEPKDGEPRLHIKEQPVPVVPEEIPKGLAGQIVSLLAHNIGDKFLAQKIWNACRNAILNGDTFRENSISSTNNFREIAETSTNSPVIPDGWISCSERMPAQDDWVLIYSKHGEYLAGQVQGEYVELNDGTLSWLGAALHWMPLPEPPKQE